MIKILLAGEPISKMRPRFSRKGTYDPQNTQKHAAKFQILSQVNRSNLPFVSIPIEIEMVFNISVRLEDKNLLEWDLLDHTQKPDIDNLCKFYLDVLNGIIYTDDKQVIKCTAIKKYNDEPGTEIYIMPKKPSCDDKVKEVLSIISPDYFCEFAAALSWIADYKASQILGGNLDFDEIVFLICEFAEKHAENLRKINKKFPGLAKILKERMEQK